MTDKPSARVRVEPRGWKVSRVEALSHNHGEVYTSDGYISVNIVGVRLRWWDRMRGITLQQKLELEVIKQRAWCTKQNLQEADRQCLNKNLTDWVRRLNEKDKAINQSSEIEIRKS